MFRLSQKADYGLILLSSLARAQADPASRERRGGFTSVSAIAKKNKIPTKFLSQIAQDLRHAGVISAREGIRGGYTLARAAEEIKLLDVLKVLDKELFSGECFEDDHECLCGAKEMWVSLRKEMEETLGKKTVADLVVDAERKTTKD